MLKNFQALREQVGTTAPKTVAVACAHDAHTLEAVFRAAEEGILRYIKNWGTVFLRALSFTRKQTQSRQKPP